MKKLLVLGMLIYGYTLSAQVAPHKYFIEFTDKNQNPYSLDHPEQFLSERAIQRRLSMGIGYEFNDIPVTPAYILAIQNTGAQILNPTKWLNGTTIYLADTNLINTIKALPFVKSVAKASIAKTGKSESPDKFNIENQLVPVPMPLPSVKNASAYNYGISYDQIHLVNGDLMHQNGFRGQGKVIAQLDAGFYHVPVLPAFDSLRANNQILGHKDFVKNGLPIFDDPTDQHGMWVLSIMGGIIPGYLIGSAPKAGFWLLKTEERSHEYETEEYNWVSGAEFADSVGADIITSSLGYTVFDSTFKDHTCADMDGHTTVCTRGANIAFSKGIVVVISAGNSGNDPSWPCISAPADADFAIACAAVDSNGNRAGFSSLGVDTAGRVKPNVAAMGALTVIQDAGGGISRGSGTSFSAPIIAGMTACLMQARPAFANSSIKKAIERSGNHASVPDSLTGYGIPDFVKAMNITSINSLSESSGLGIYPNPVLSQTTLNFKSGIGGRVTIKFINSLGKTVWAREAIIVAGDNKLIINDISGLKPGVYIVVVDSDFCHARTKMIKQPD
ncbi:MAG: S8 family serine peptidase [Bacteroidetes bacterium]|nr:S8 family serine peptidase [Bacteroidota bacterium]